jgi:DNA-binding response OmpR family regulator
MDSPLNILLAEDERSVAFSISFALKPDGHRIEVVMDGEQALAEVRIKPGTFDLLITDHSTPRMNGVELVRQLREAGFRGKTLVLSAHLSLENRAAYETLGVDGLLPKPFDLFQLRDLIGRIVRGEAPPISEQSDSFQAGRMEVYRLLKLGLSEDDAPPEAES